MMDVLNQSGDYTALYIGVESAQAARNDVAAGMKSILGSLAYGAEARLQDARLHVWQQEMWPVLGEHAARERLIRSRATHLDQLTDKLREPRVHAI